jgi:hypothetical protein
MRIISDEKKISRNVKIGEYAFTAGMVLLIGAFFINLYAISKPDQPTLVFYAFGAFLIGFTATNVGTLFKNRWGRRPDRQLADSLKGLDDRYTLYNFRLASPHVLVGPGGIMVLHPKYQAGPVYYDRERKRWQAPSAPRGLFALFSQDPMGNPAMEAAAEADVLTSFFKKRLPETPVAPLAVIVFMHPRAEVSAKDAPVPALHAKQLKEYIRRLPKGPTLGPLQQADFEARLGLAPAKSTG